MLLIACPSCATTYRLAPDLFGAEGRTVRCTRCLTVWQAKPQSATPEVVGAGAAQGASRPAPPEPPFPAEPVSREPAPEAVVEADVVESTPPEPVAVEVESPSLVPEPDPHEADPAVEERPREEDVETLAARRARIAKPRGKRRGKAGGGPPRAVLAVLALLVFAVALVVGRTEIVRWLPDTARLYAAVGLEVNLRGLAFADVKTSRELQDGVPVLTVEGQIRNVAGRPTEVPRMRLVVRGADGRELDAWTANPGRSMLGPGETLAFRSRLAAPPEAARDVLVRFLAPRDIGAR